MGRLEILRVLNFAIGAYTVVIGLLFGVFFLLPALIERDMTTVLIAVIGLLIFLLLAGIGAAHVVVGYLVGSGRGRIPQTLLALTQLTSFPFGTGYALYALWVCWVDEDAKRAFDRAIKPPVT